MNTAMINDSLDTCANNEMVKLIDLINEMNTSDDYCNEFIFVQCNLKYEEESNGLPQMFTVAKRFEVLLDESNAVPMLVIKTHDNANMTIEGIDLTKITDLQVNTRQTPEMNNSFTHCIEFYLGYYYYRIGIVYDKAV